MNTHKTIFQLFSIIFRVRVPYLKSDDDILG
jgi:hypothetical protein